MELDRLGPGRGELEEGRIASVAILCIACFYSARTARWSVGLAAMHPGRCIRQLDGISFSQIMKPQPLKGSEGLFG